MLLDVSGTFVGFIAAYWLRYLLSDYIPYHIETPFHAYFRLYLYSIPVIFVLFRSVGLYDRHILFYGTKEYILVVKGCAYYILSLIVISFAIRDFYPSRIWLLGSWMLMIAFVSGGRFVFRRYLKKVWKKGNILEKVLILGVSEESRAIAERLENFGLVKVIGFLDDFTPRGSKVWNDKTVLGPPSHYTKIAQREGATLAIVLLDAISWETKKEVFQEASKKGKIEIQIAPGVGELHLMAMDVIFRGNVPLLRFHLGYITGMDAILKLGMDYLLGLILLIMLSPIMFGLGMILLAKGIWPIIDRIEVLGENGRMFYTYKFRTGFSDSLIYRNFRRKVVLDAVMGKGTTNSLGRFLFRTGLDKLPQLFNVLMGKMSLVGPRTVSIKSGKEYGEWLPGILAVKPGMTGNWALQEARDLEQEILFTILYVRDWNIWKDLVIFWDTIVEVFRSLFRMRNS